METATNNNEDIVQKISGAIIGNINKPGIPPETAELRLFFDVYMQDTEIGSGASFEQYFRWADKEKIENIVSYLETLELHTLAAVTSSAINIAFPHGIPINEVDFEELTEWTEEQLDTLEKHYHQVEHLHGVVTNRLGEYAQQNGIVKMSRFDGLF